MNEKRVKQIAAISAILALAVAILMQYAVKAEYALELIYYPFQLIASGLRQLSFSGTGGNLAAIVLYGAVCMIPCVYLLIRLRKRIVIAADLLLVLMSLFLFYMLYVLINPQLMGRINSLMSDGQTMIRISLAIVFFGILTGYAAVRIVKGIEDRGTPKNLKLMRALLTALAVGFPGILVYTYMFQLMGRLPASQGNNSDLDVIQEPSGSPLLFLILTILALLPIWFMLKTLFAATGTLDSMEAEPYSQGLIENTNRLARAAKRTVYAIVACSLLDNWIQLFFSSAINNVNLILRFPFVPLCLALGAMVLAHYMKEHNQLYEDKQSII